jgi:hypothetical protein
MKTHTAKFGNIKLDYSLITNVEEYIDVEIYALLPTNEEYLVTVYKYNGEGDIVDPTYRYSKNRTDCFSDGEVKPPKEVKNAINSIMPHITEIILREEALRQAKEKRKNASTKVRKHTMKKKTTNKKSGGSNREKQLKKAITNRLAEKGISKDWMKKNLLVIC